MGTFESLVPFGFLFNTFDGRANCTEIMIMYLIKNLDIPKILLELKSEMETYMYIYEYS
jgi:hypothetical protein